MASNEWCMSGGGVVSLSGRAFVAHTSPLYMPSFANIRASTTYPLVSLIGIALHQILGIIDFVFNGDLVQSFFMILHFTIAFTSCIVTFALPYQHCNTHK
jgi:hypothetical protein